MLNAGSQTLSVTFTPFNAADYATTTPDTVILTSNKNYARDNMGDASDYHLRHGPERNPTGCQLEGSRNILLFASNWDGAECRIAIIICHLHPIQYNRLHDGNRQHNSDREESYTCDNMGNAEAITYGTALSATQLDASSTVAGTFTYSPAAGTVLTAGSETLTIAFTPSNTIDYTTAAGSVVLTVNKATPTVTLTSSASSIVSGASVTFTATVGRQRS